MTKYDAVLMRDDASTQEFDNIPETMLVDLLSEDGVIDADIRYHEHNCRFSSLEHWSWLTRKIKEVK